MSRCMTHQIRCRNTADAHFLQQRPTITTDVRQGRLKCGKTKVAWLIALRRQLSNKQTDDNTRWKQPAAANNNQSNNYQHKHNCNHNHSKFDNYKHHYHCCHRTPRRRSTKQVQSLLHCLGDGQICSQPFQLGISLHGKSITSHGQESGEVPAQARYTSLHRTFLQRSDGARCSDSPNCSSSEG